MRLRAIRKQVIVEPRQEPKESNGLALPDQAIPEPTTGVVLVVYKGCKDLKPGDIVLLPKHHKIKVRHQSRSCYLLEESEILAILEAETKGETE